MTILCVFQAHASAVVNNSPTMTLRSGLVGYWTFDGQNTNWATGQTFDMSGNGNTGTMTNMTSSTVPAPGKMGQAFKFDGVDDRVNLGSVASLNSSNISYSAWIKILSTAVTQTIYGMEDSGATQFREFDNTAGKLTLWTGGSTGYVRYDTSAVVLTANVWTHLVVTQVGTSSPSFYVNGVLKSSVLTTLSATPNLPATQVSAIGRPGAFNAQYFKGLIDDVRIYNRVLSPREIQTLYQLSQAKFNNSPVVSLASGLVGYWTFDGQNTNWATGQTFDMSGNRNTGTMTNMTSSTVPVPGKIGQAFKFDGVNYRVNIGSPASLSLTGDLTISAWINTKTVAAGNAVIIGNGNGAGNAQWDLEMNRTAGKVGYVHAGGSAAMIVTCNTTLKINAWYHVVVVRTGSSSAWTINCYLNGASDGASTGTGTLVSNQTITIGTFQGAAFFNGLIDDVRVYNRALSPREVQMLYQLGQAKINNSPVMSLTSGLVGYWTFDGQNTNWATGQTFDMSGNRNTGTMTNMTSSTVSVAGKIGQGFRFDGVNDYVGVTYNNNLPIYSTTTPYSVTFWVKGLTINQAECIFCEGNTSNAVSQFAIRTGVAPSKNIRISIESDAGVIELNTGSTGNVFDNRWHHIVWMDNQGAGKLYIDGSLDATNFSYTAATTTLNTTSIGALVQKFSLSGSNFFPGSLDDVRIYNRALSAREVQMLYNLGR